jgi:glycosyltransferase involved in cell wall biosynthesis
MPGRDKTFSLIIPVYRNEANLPRLLAALENLRTQFPCDFEVVFVVDGSPDRCHEILAARLPEAGFASQLIALSRNFGSFSAIMAGLKAAEGDYCGVMAADLQEPPELMLEFYRILSSGETDICFGHRASRVDPWFTELTSNLFWWVYRTYIVKDMPPGGVDVFACTRAMRDHIAQFRELNTNLVALLFWVGFRRAYVPYHRQQRLEGKSAWTLAKKLRYALDSIFNFTELPLQMLTYIGLFGLAIAIGLTVLVLAAKLTGRIDVPGYTPVVLVITFFGGLTSLGLGIIGRYLWLALENVRGRPGFIVQSVERIPGRILTAQPARELRNSP